VVALVGFILVVVAVLDAIVDVDVTDVQATTFVPEIVAMVDNASGADMLNVGPVLAALIHTIWLNGQPHL